MQWAFTAALPMSPTGRPLKRSTSNPQLPPHAKRTAMSSVAAAAAQQPGGGSSGNGGGLPAVDVQAVAEKHGWDLQQRNDWSEDKRVVWLPVAAIRRPLQGSRSNGEGMLPLLAHWAWGVALPAQPVNCPARLLRCSCCLPLPLPMPTVPACSRC